MNRTLLRLVLLFLVATSLSNCSSSRNHVSANIIHGMPSGGAMPIYVVATYQDLKAGGLSAGWMRGWTQAEFEFLRLYPNRQICTRDTQTPACRDQMPIGLVVVPKQYLTGEIPGSLALYHMMSGTGDLIGGAGGLLSGVAWFRGVRIGISGGPLASSSSYAEGGSSSSKSYSNANSKSSSSSSANSSSHSKSNKNGDYGHKPGHSGGGYGGGGGGAPHGGGGGYGGGSSHGGGGYGGGMGGGGYGGKVW